MNEAVRELMSLDRTIHEPGRLMIVAILSAAAEADFLYLQQATGLTKGNLSLHLSRLEKMGFIEITKSYIGKRPHTSCSLTKEGLAAFEKYRRQMKAVI